VAAARDVAVVVAWLLPDGGAGLVKIDYQWGARRTINSVPAVYLWSAGLLAAGEAARGSAAGEILMISWEGPSEIPLRFHHLTWAAAGAARGRGERGGGGGQARLPAPAPCRGLHTLGAGRRAGRRRRRRRRHGRRRRWWRGVRCLPAAAIVSACGGRFFGPRRALKAPRPRVPGGVCRGGATRRGSTDKNARRQEREVLRLSYSTAVELGSIVKVKGPTARAGGGYELRLWCRG
jgi:hypothetical protein